MYKLLNNSIEQSQYVRPMKFGEILNASVRLYCEKFRYLVIAQLPLTLFYMVYELPIFHEGTDISSSHVFDLFTGRTEQLPQYFLIIFLLEALWVALMYPITHAAVTTIASGTVLNTPSSVKDAYRFCLPNWVKLGVTNVIITCALVIVEETIIMIFNIDVLRDMSGSPAVLGALVSAFLWARWAVTFPIMVNEDTFAVGALRRSWSMVKGKTLKTYFVIIIITLIAGIPLLFAGILEFFLGESLILTIGADIAAIGLVAPIIGCAQVVIYFELKARKKEESLKKVERAPMNKSEE